MRCVLTVLALVAPALASAGSAGSGRTLAERKEELKELRAYDREVRLVTRRFDRAVRHDRDDKRRALLPELQEIGRVEIARLKDQGLTTRTPPVPSQPRKLPPAEHPRRQAVWDALVELRDLADSDRKRELKRASDLLEVVRDHVDARRDRAEERYEAAKSGA